MYSPMHGIDGGFPIPLTEIFRQLARSFGSGEFGMDDPLFADDDRALMETAVDAKDARLPGGQISE